MSKSHHDKPRRSPAERATVARRARAYRRAANRFARQWDDTLPVPATRGMRASMCGYGCCW